MKRLLNLSISREYDLKKNVEIKRFSDEAIFVVDYFFLLLKQNKWPSPYNYISVTLGTNNFEYDSGMYEKGIRFDFDQFYDKDSVERKLAILKILVEVFEGICILHKLDSTIIQEIHDEIVGSKFQRYVKNKLFRNPNHLIYAGILCQCIENTVNVLFQIFAKDKVTLLESELLFQIPTQEFDQLESMKPKWLDKKTFLLNDENQEITDSRQVGSFTIVN